MAKVIRLVMSDLNEEKQELGELRELLCAINRAGHGWEEEASWALRRISKVKARMEFFRSELASAQQVWA